MEEEEGPQFDLKCPRCEGHCVGRTRSSGRKSTYRNPYVKFAVDRITCGQCGYTKDMDLYVPQKLKLWYYFEVPGGAVWFHTRERMLFMKEFLEGGFDRNESSYYALPKWMLIKKTRALILAEIDAILASEQESSANA